MSDLMTFPDTVEEFMEQYKVTDTEQVYSNGAEYVPIFRMKQWFEHLPTAEKKGKWIVHKSPDDYHCGMVECPFCGEELIAEPNEYCCCPNCGARMEE